MTPHRECKIASGKGVTTWTNMFRAFDEIKIPDHLRANMERHLENVCALVDLLGHAGIDEETIERSVAEVIASYRAELMNSIKLLHKDASNAQR